MGFLRFLNEIGVQGDGGPTHAVATDGVYLAYALPGGPRVELHCLTGLGGGHGPRGPHDVGRPRPPVQLQSEMQQRPVISLCFGAGHIGTSDPAPSSAGGGGRRPSSHQQLSKLPAVLFCGSWDAVVAWNVSAVTEAVARGHHPPPPIQVMSDQGPVYCMTYSASLSYLVVGTGADVNVFDVRTFRHLYRLDGHSADVLAASFCPPPSSPQLLVTAGADRTFKIWDLQAGSLVMQSSVLGPAPLTCIAIEPSHPPRLALGSADGSLRLFDLSSLPAARLLQVIDVGRKVGRALATAAAAAAEAAAAAAGPKVISSRPAWKAAMGLQRQASSGSDTGGGNGDDEDEDGDGTGSGADGGVGNPYILQLSYTGPGPPPPPSQQQQLHLPDILGADGGDDIAGGGRSPSLLLPACPSLLVAMAGAVSLIDTRSYDVVEAFLLGRADPGPPAGSGSGSGLAAMGRQGRGGPPAGALAAPPPPPPTLRPRLALRGMPRVEPSGCVAFAVVPPAAAATDGEAGTRSGGVMCCTASSREPTVAVLRYEPSDPGGDAAAGWSSATLRLQRTPSGVSSAAAAAATSRSRPDSASGDAGEPISGGYGSGSYDNLPTGGGGADAGDDAAVAISVFQTGPLPADSPLRAPSSAGAGGASVLSPSGSVSSAAGGGGGGGRRASSAGPSRPGGSVASPAGKAAAANGARFTSPSTGRRPPPPSSSSSSPSSKPVKPAPAIKNQPVTFHSKIKSSGYGFVQPSTQLGRAPPPPVKLSARPSAVSSVGRHLVEARQYPADCGPLTAHQPRNALPGGQAVHPGGAIVRIAYSSDASRLLTASANRTARVLKLPVSRWGGEGTDLVGHGAPLHGADWSREGTLVLTASADRTARLWNAACAQPLLEFSHLNTQPPARPTGPAGAPAMPPPPPPPAASPGGGGSGRGPNPLLLHEVRAARFVYMDQFIALACGNKLLLYRYKLAEDADSDIERLRARHSYRLVASYTSPAQALHDFSAVNSFLSPLAIASASNRGLELIDMTTMRPLAAVQEAHQRPVGCVAQAGTASLFVNHPREAYELFATSAPDNTVKLWDVRTPQRCVRAFAGHKNSQLPSLAVSFSPCLRFLGVGSEDKQAYLYDIRQGVVGHKVGRGAAGEAVSGVAFNPLHPQMALACLDGKVHFFSDGGAMA
ncbi:hypothetical protein PLESTB_001960900 [Pleodorina starrii]|uniref:Uncharacterized protein n=1 Tax=Pleodorina starrii TaxID=330485 RepID=A0A9W6C402_9CHLO|nr:hypothetical protein PLESTM_002070000 [Pleodorina starrii]GLC62930.1 hypothetical protein PLESTB_001960900 [Pleodorina starrii]GLC70335.1 hypothetical protein PLESTF_000961400 [Pleodorina starrii]